MDSGKPDRGTRLTAKTTEKVNINSRRWHFLLVGEHGQIKSVKKFRGLVIAAVAVVAIAVIGIAGLGFLYLRALAHNSQMNHRMADLRQQVASIQAEKEILMARLVIAETKLEGDSRPTPEPTPETDAGPTAAEAIPPATEQEPVRQEPQPPPTRQTEATSAVDLSPASSGEQTTIAVEDLQAILDTYQNVLRVQYKVRNTRNDGTKVAGRTVLILKNSEQDQNSWVVLPDVKLVDGRPTGDQGQPFRILRFRIAKFTVEGYLEPSKFDLATVFVYSRSGELILEKEFAVQIKVT